MQLLPPKVILSVDRRLYRRLDVSPYDQAIEEIRKVGEEHPEFDKGYQWRVRTEETNGSFGRVRITIYHPTKRDWSVVLYFGILAIIAAVLIAADNILGYT